MARVVTDRATFAWLCDVYVDPAARGRGLGTWLAGAVRDHLDELGVRRILLATNDAHAGVRARSGFTPLDAPQRWMKLDRRTAGEPGHRKGTERRHAPYGGGVTPLRLGYLYGLGAYLLWGFFPLYLSCCGRPARWRSWPTGSSGRWCSSALLLAALRNIGFLRALLRRPWAMAGIGRRRRADRGQLGHLHLRRQLRPGGGDRARLLHQPAGRGAARRDGAAGAAAPGAVGGAGDRRVGGRGARRRLRPAAVAGVDPGVQLRRLRPGQEAARAAAPRRGSSSSRRCWRCRRWATWAG